MKIKELIPLLQKMDPEFEVILSCDNEGNSFSPLEKLSHGYYERDSPFYVEVDETDRSEHIAHNSVTMYPET